MALDGCPNQVRSCRLFSIDFPDLDSRFSDFFSSLFQSWFLHLCCLSQSSCFCNLVLGFCCLSQSSSDAGAEGPGTEASFSASPSIQHECGECDDQIAWQTTSSACCHAKSETESGSDDNDAQFGCQGCAEDLESEQPHKRERERHLYMSDEQMFASFSAPNGNTKESGATRRRRKAGRSTIRNQWNKRARVSLCS